MPASQRRSSRFGDMTVLALSSGYAFKLGVLWEVFGIDPQVNA
ncbi:hypothetical protein EDD27_6600 [Nonomuraea polychroma]|uniref:Uncharacterized protein n=1 Tax=Nonomuraea polychroma TaxID=46176 RepID=A0A438MDS3_9ACTN|nr:hypothetical protein EDD27_6600 [Nonomuraea polychroma]